MASAAHKPDFETLPNGRLADINTWTPEIAQVMAQNEGLNLGDDHWAIINLMRDFYATYNISPIRKLLLKSMRKNLGEQYANDEHLDALFPNNVLVQGTRLAGLPVPMLDAEVDYQKHRNSPPRQFESQQSAPDGVKHYTNDFEFEGNTVQVYRLGNLVDPSIWNEKMAIHLAEKEGISLTDQHWEIINYLRGYYFQYGVTPMVRLLMDDLRDARGEAAATKDHLYELYPGGPARQGSRIAGLPEPQGCIDT